MDWSIVQQYLPFYQKAFFLTLHIAVLGILGSFLLGLVVSVIRHYRVPILSQLSTAYIELSRNTPLLIQLFFLYFGLPRIGLVLSSEACAVVGLIFLGGSYMAESFPMWSFLRQWLWRFRHLVLTSSSLSRKRQYSQR